MSPVLLYIGLDLGRKLVHLVLLGSIVYPLHRGACLLLDVRLLHVMLGRGLILGVPVGISGKLPSVCLSWRRESS